MDREVFSTKLLLKDAAYCCVRQPPGTAGKQKSVRSGRPLSAHLQEGHSLWCQGHSMLLTSFHPCCWNDPSSGFQVDLAPGCSRHLGNTGRGQDQKTKSPPRHSIAFAQIENESGNVSI